VHLDGPGEGFERFENRIRRAVKRSMTCFIDSRRFNGAISVALGVSMRDVVVRWVGKRGVLDGGERQRCLVRSHVGQ